MGVEAVIFRDVRFRMPLALLTILLVHTTLLSQVRIAGVMPDAMLLVSLAAGVVGGPGLGAVVGFGSGMATDLFLPTPLGLSALVFCLCGYATGVARGGLLRWTWWFPVVAAFFSSAAGVGLFAVTAAMLGETQLLTSHLLVVMLVVGITNALLAPLVLRMVRWATVSTEPARAYAP